MNKTVTLTFLLFLSTLGHQLNAQALILLDSCGFSYIDPQDVAGQNTPSLDTLIYTNYFEEEEQLISYYIDINAFGGQQTDRAFIYAIFPDNSEKKLGDIAFGNCVDCVNGFALVNNDSLLVSEVTELSLMNMWLASLNQPDFALTNNLQTLIGVGRLSGHVPLCAIGLKVVFIVNNNPNSSSTQFAAHIICPEPVAPCGIDKNVTIDCIQDSVSLEAILPAPCFGPETQVQWVHENGLILPEVNTKINLSDNEGWVYLEVVNDCCSFIDSVFINNPSFANAGADIQVCEGDSFTITGSGGVNYIWELPNGTRVENQQFSPEEASLDLTGTYLLEVFNEEGCLDTDTLVVEVNSPVIPQVVVNSPCLGETLSLSIQNDSDFTQVSWIDPNGSPLMSSQILNFQSTDQGLYQVITTDQLGCSTPTFFEVQGNTPPTYEAVFEESCDSTRVYLYPEQLQYQWNTGDEGSRLATATGGIFQLTITDSLGCSSLEELFVPIPEGPEVLLNVTQPVCPGELGQLEIITDDARPVIYSIDGGTTYFLRNEFNAMIPDDYLIVVQDDLGCIQEFPISILSPDTLGVYLDETPLEVRPTTPIQLQAATIGNIQEIQWLPREIDTGTNQTSFTALKDMDIRVIVKDDKGCHATAGFPLTIVLGDIYAPNAFSPNGDGVNDYFTLYSDQLSGEIIERLEIYDRYGGLIFRAEEIALNDASAGWDGFYQGKLMNPGILSFYGIIRFGDGSIEIIKGDVTLLR